MRVMGKQRARDLVREAGGGRERRRPDPHRVLPSALARVYCPLVFKVRSPEALCPVPSNPPGGLLQGDENYAHLPNLFWRG